MKKKTKTKTITAKKRKCKNNIAPGNKSFDVCH